MQMPGTEYMYIPIIDICFTYIMADMYIYGIKHEARGCEKAQG